MVAYDDEKSSQRNSRNPIDEQGRTGAQSGGLIDRIESGADCRMSTKRKIILALGLNLTDRNQVFPGDE
ncbi:MAG: XRE family transcriptional regulator [Desulfuromonadales bacterium]